jgi:4-hydroxy-tetrahydrodipicolinate reductase
MIEVVCFGLGPIGLRIARCIAGRPGYRIIGAVDIDPAKRGKELDEFIAGASTRVRIVGDVADLPEHSSQAVAVHATTSIMKDAQSQFEALARSGYNIVTTCEEMTFPYLDDSAANAINEAAVSNGVSVIGSGINPGFLMDSLPLVLSSACVSVSSVRVRRIVDTNQRRLPLQKKVGVSMTEDEFRGLAADGKLGHMGLRQSAELLAAGLGWKISGYTETLEPVITTQEVETGLGKVPPGGVIGQHQIATATADGREVIRYELDMYAGGETIDAIDIDGDPLIRQEIKGGVNGDIGTEAMIVNLIPVVSAARPGLLTMTDVLALRCQMS